MKMKEVMARTGLTDRAVRLYVDNGLASPEVETNYAGRRTLNFSEADIETLRQIALLRKAGFSLEQIGQVQQGQESAKEAVRVFLDEKREETRKNERVLRALSGLPGESYTLRALAAALEPAFAAEQVPEADLHMSAAQRAEQILFTVLALALVGGAGALYWPALSLLGVLRLRYPKPNAWDITFFLPVLILIAALVSFSLLGAWRLIHRYRHVRPGKKDRKKRVGRSTLLSVLIFAADLCLTFFFFFTAFAEFFVSETEKPEHYLLTDENLRPAYGEIYRVFPAEIPFSAGETRYRYFYGQFGSDVFAEWRYCVDRRPYYYHSPRQDYEENGETLPETDPELIEGTWLFFAYRDDLAAIRYYYGENNPHKTPLFHTLDWV